MTHKLEITLLVLGCIAMLALIVLVGGTAYYGLPVLKHFDAIASQSDNVIKDAQKRLDGTSQNLNAFLIQIGLTADQIRRTSMQQSANAEDTAQQLAKILNTAQTTVTDLDTAVNSLNTTIVAIKTNTIPAANSELASLKDMTDTLNNESKLILPAATLSLKGVSQVLDSTNQLLTDPDITKGIKSLSDGASHLDSTSAALDKTAWYIERSFEPQHEGFWKRVLEFAIPGIFHLVPQAVTIVH